MAAQDFSQTQIHMLERRWRQDPSPHLSLQLADLYRQKGQMKDAIPVLEKGLSAHPGHLSVQVALGRYRLEGGDPEGAAEVLADVVRRDAGHLVANKLLVKAYLAVGDVPRARDRLELYAILNDGDPELGALRSAVGGEAPFAPGQPSAAADLGSLRPPASRSLRGALDREPFTALLATPFEAAAVEEIFTSIQGISWVHPAASAPPPAAGQAEPVETTEPAGEPEPAEEPASAPEAAALDVEPAEEEARSGFETRYFEMEPPPAPPETKSEPESEPEPELEAEPETGAEVEAAASSAPTELDVGASATSTLGALYLAQGHLEEAQATFEQVLDRDPDDAEAQAGLEEITRRRLGVTTGSAVATGRNRGKIEALRLYLDRIRAAADRLSA